MKAVILAAGESSRFRPVSDNRHKGLMHIGGKTVVEQTVEELRSIGVEDVIIVEGPERQFKQELGEKCEYAVQEKPEGMGNALKQAKNKLEGRFLVLNPYHVLSMHVVESLVEKAEEEGSSTGLVSTTTSRPEEYGILDIEDGRATGAVEKPDPEDAPSNQRIVGTYLLDASSFFEHLGNVEKWEYQFEDALDRQLSESPATVLQISENTASLKYPWDILDFSDMLLDEKFETGISSAAEIAESAQIKGEVYVGADAKIHENAVVKGPAYIGEGVTVGNNALVRDSTFLEENCAVGANAEIKNTVMQPSSSIHSGFLGDTIVGRSTKIGAGTITANRTFRNDSGSRNGISSKPLAKDNTKQTGRQYMGAVIGDQCDIGVNVSIMPGVQIGSNSTVGPGTTVKNNVKTSQTVYQETKTVRKSKKR